MSSVSGLLRLLTSHVSSILTNIFFPLPYSLDKGWIMLRRLSYQPRPLLSRIRPWPSPFMVYYFEEPGAGG